MKRATMFLFILMLSAVMSVPAMAFDPITHQFMSNEALSDTQLASSNIAQICLANKEWFNAGFQIIDITVIYYYTEGSKYEATHNWLFQQRMMETATNDQERAFAYGIAAHLIQDSVSHNHYIPKKIEQTYVPNYFIHPLQEAAMAAHLLKISPQSYEEARRSLNTVYSDKAFLKKIQNNVMASSGVELDVEGLTGIFNEAMGSPGGFFTEVFHLPDIYKAASEGDFVGGVTFLVMGILLVTIALYILKQGSMFKIPIFIIAGLFMLIAAFLLAGGLTAITNIDDADYYVDMATERMVYLFQPQNWEQRYSYEPTGFTALNKADAKVLPVDIAVVLIIIGVIFFKPISSFIGRK